MSIFAVFIFLIFLVSITFFGNKKPILFLILGIWVLFITASDLTASGNDWVNNFWGLILFLCALYWFGQYKKYRH